MDATRFKELQDDEQREESPDTAIRTFIRGELVDVHTCMPGIIKSFDAAKQTAVVQPAIRRLFVGRGFINLPQCVDVPVIFPRGGNFVITFPVAAGDECLLTFGERAIDFWWDRGGTQEPAEPRMHDLSDAFAHLGCSSKGRVPSNVATDAFELRTLDGATVIRVTDTEILFNGGTQGVARLADSTQLTMSPADIAALATLLLTTGAFTPSGGPASPAATPMVFVSGQITSASANVKAGG